MRVRYCIKHTISLALLTLLLCCLFLPLRNVLASPDSETLRPNAAGYFAYLYPVPVETPNWDCVDETPANDSDYVSTDINDQLPELDLYNIVNTTIESSDTIYNVTVSIRVKSSSNTYKAGFNTEIRTHDTRYDGVLNSPTTTYTTYSTTYTTNPNTGANWTVQELNDLQIGVNGYSGKRTSGSVIYPGFCTQVWCDIFFLPVSGKAWHDVSSWAASLITRTWSSGTSWAANLIARTWSSGTSFSFNLLTRQNLTVASWLFDFGTRIWVDAATWTFDWVTMAWENITWIFYLGTSIWTDIATWAANLSAMLWNDVAAWVFYPLTMMWRDLTWLFTLLPALPQWVNVAVWIFHLAPAKWIFPFIWIIMAGFIGLCCLVVSTKPQEKRETENV